MSIAETNELPVSRTASAYLREALREVCCGLDYFLVDLAEQYARGRNSSLVEGQDVEAAVTTLVKVISRDLSDQSFPEHHTDDAIEMIKKLKKLMLRATPPRTNRTMAMRSDAFGMAQLDELEQLRKERGNDFGVRTRPLRGVPSTD